MRVKDLIGLLKKAPQDDMVLVKFYPKDMDFIIDNVSVYKGTLRGKTTIDLNPDDVEDTYYCKNESAVYDNFECSECGLTMEENERYELDEYYRKEMYAFSFDYCPRCGRRVKE